MSDLAAQDTYCPLCNGIGRVTAQKAKDWLSEHDRLMLAIDKAGRAGDMLAVSTVQMKKMTTDDLIRRMRAALKIVSGTAFW